MVPSATAWAAGERSGVAASVAAHSPISSESGEDWLESVLRTNAVDNGWENSWMLVASCRMVRKLTASIQLPVMRWRSAQVTPSATVQLMG